MRKFPPYYQEFFMFLLTSLWKDSMVETFFKMWHLVVKVIISKNYSSPPPSVKNLFLIPLIQFNIKHIKTSFNYFPCPSSILFTIFFYPTWSISIITCFNSLPQNITQKFRALKKLLLMFPKTTRHAAFHSIFIYEFNHEAKIGLQTVKTKAKFFPNTSPGRQFLPRHINCSPSMVFCNVSKCNFINGQLTISHAVFTSSFDRLFCSHCWCSKSISLLFWKLRRRYSATFYPEKGNHRARPIIFLMPNASQFDWKLLITKWYFVQCFFSSSFLNIREIFKCKSGFNPMIADASRQLCARWGCVSDR